jgi:Tol biopolymer transport system component
LDSIILNEAAIMNRRFVHKRELIARLSVMIAVTMAACNDSVPPEPPLETQPDPLPVLATAIVSNPVAASASASRAPGLALRGTATAEVVYVSLPPGTIPDGNQATVRNLRTGSVVTVAMLDGGFDPVAVTAAAGDTLELDVRLTGPDDLLRYAIVVPVRRPPIVVRTDPPPKKRDVPLNATMLIVFSEPIDPATLTDSSVRLSLAGSPVAGTLGLGDAAHLTATFTPAASLAAGVEYTLLMTQGIEDMTGDGLESPTTVTFTTETVPRVGSIVVRVATTGTDLQTGDYRLDIDGAAGPPMGLNDTVSLADLQEGSHTVGLRGVAVNCTVAGPNPRTVAVAFGETATVAFDVTCDPVTQLAFVRDGQIYLVTSTGTGLVRLSDGPNDGDPAWSPDGQRIAFTRTHGDTSDIYVMDADGSNVVWRMSAREAEAPSWSPDGLRIAFAALGGSDSLLRGWGSSNVYVMSADDDGTGVTAVVDLPGYDTHPAWSPDDKIAFVSDWRAYDFLYDLYVVNADGSGMRALVEGPFFGPTTYYFQPAWSPDGSRIAIVVCPYASQNCFPTSTVAIVNADGSGLTPLAAAGGYAKPTWSPDGQTIAFASSTCSECTPSIRYVRADGSEQGVIVADGHSPAWRR